MAFGALGLGFYSSPDIRFGIGFAIGHSKHTCFVFWDHRILCGCWGYCTMFPSPELRNKVDGSAGYMAWQAPAFRLKARVICDNLLTQLDPEHLRKTGRVTRVHHFRSAKNRSLFRWVFHTHNNRFFTTRAVREALRLMFQENPQLAIPSVPGLKFSEWCRQEADTLQKLLCKARRSIAMDNEDTQMPEDHWASDHNFKIIAQSLSRTTFGNCEAHLSIPPEGCWQCR